MTPISERLAKIRADHLPEPGDAELQAFTGSTSNCVRDGCAQPCQVNVVLAALDALRDISHEVAQDLVRLADRLEAYVEDRRGKT
jgi:hypothetical protein